MLKYNVLHYKKKTDSHLKIRRNEEIIWAPRDINRFSHLDRD